MNNRQVAVALLFAPFSAACRLCFSSVIYCFYIGDKHISGFLEKIRTVIHSIRIGLFFNRIIQPGIIFIISYDHHACICSRFGNYRTLCTECPSPQQSGCNVVSLGIFSWSTLEPEEGVFHFGWLQEIIDKLYKRGISTILATPSGARPKWMADKYPEVLRVDETRHRALFGFRHNHCLHNFINIFSGKFNFFLPVISAFFQKFVQYFNRCIKTYSLDRINS